MAAATVAALRVLGHVNIVIAVISLALNFSNRKHDVLNTMLLFSVAQFATSIDLSGARV